MFRHDPPEVTSRRLASAGTLVASLEMLCQARKFEEGELLSSQLHNFYPRFAKRFPRLTRVLNSKPAAMGLYAAQAGASAATMVWPQHRGVRAVGSAVLAAAGAADRLRSNFGGDGADQMQQVLNVVHATTATIKDPRQGREIAMSALALETTLSYVASGAVKAVSPVWLRGEAFDAIIRTRNYGDQRVYALVQRYPSLGKLVSWGTIAAELGFPLVYFLPLPLARAYLGAMLLFHLGIGQFMGLNRFVVAFGATHPGLLHVLRKRSERAALEPVHTA